MSLPSWERGLKLLTQVQYYLFEQVAPLVGAWIETNSVERTNSQTSVAPLVGAWIETNVRQARSSQN